jgi:hypothetical protein
MELQRKSRIISTALNNCAAYPNLDSWENVRLEFLSPQYHIAGRAIFFIAVH